VKFLRDFMSDRDIKPSLFSAENRRRAVYITMGATLVIAFLDVVVAPRISLGFLYLYPLILASGYFSWWKVLPLAMLYAVLAEVACPDVAGSAINQHTVVTVGGFTVAALFAAQLGMNRRRLESQFREIETSDRLRQEAQEEFRVLIETSAAAIVTVDADGRILESNRSAERVLGVGPESLRNEPIETYLPFLSGVFGPRKASPVFRTMVEGRGKRRDGSPFFAQVWFSTYQTSSGPRMAAIIWDASEQIRDREELGLRQLLTSSRIFMGAVSHEIRNLCAAISVVYLNLEKKNQFALDPDFQALGKLVEGLRQLSSSELRQASAGDLTVTDLAVLLEEVNIIANPTVEESEAEIEWEISPELPPVRADRSALLQVLLNLVNNAVRAVKNELDKTVSVVAYALEDDVVVRICNRGPVIKTPQDLFQPFQTGASSSGLGLYVSRAIVRTFKGELSYLHEGKRHCFLVQLKPVTATGEPRLRTGRN